MPTKLLSLLSALIMSWHACGQDAFFQAHRGGLEEVPENTLAAMRHAWAIPGAVPEVDLRTTEDGHIVCLHDATLARTTDAPEDLRNKDVNELTLAAVQRWDAGSWFDARYAGETIPTLDAVFEMMKEADGREIYLDLKDVDLEALNALIQRHGVSDRIIFVHGDPDVCAELQARFDGARTMTWLSGAPRVIKRRFAQLAQQNFRGISQLQFHLQGEETDGGIVYVFDPNYLREAVAITQAAGVALQVRPFVFDGESLRRLREMGINWYVADAPQAFRRALEDAAQQGPPESRK